MKKFLKYTKILVNLVRNIQQGINNIQLITNQSLIHQNKIQKNL